MKLARILLLVWATMIILPSCASAEKAAKERRNLMMPHKSDLKRNSKYKAPKAKKTYKPAKHKKR